jgi:uncharacterized damage-inducible protein DinB
MRPTDIAELFDHLYWMRDRILTAADAPGVPLTTDAHATIRDLRATLVHELDVEWSWRVRLASPDPTEFSADDEELDPVDFETLDEIRSRWADDEPEMRTWLATLDDEALNAPCTAEHDAAHPFWVHLQHLYSHAIQQFSDCAVALTLAGRSPGELDFLDFVLERERAAREAPIVDTGRHDDAAPRT